MNNRFTFFTPTYNRADLISRVFVSLKEQELKNFEWIIIDDGSTDNTIEVVNEFINYADFPIKFISKSNQGKVRAINDALELASNEWFIVFDSDDWCDKNTTKVLTDEISSLEKMGIINSYCSISVLKRYKNGKIVGDDYSSINKYGCDYISRSMLGIKGDKWEIIKTSCHKNFRYELIGNEKYQAPSYVWIKMAEKYLTVFLNKSLSTIEYQE
ncbi:TPA: glycosyltransferase family A protein, partial [Vibrio alginolyticus]